MFFSKTVGGFSEGEMAFFRKGKVSCFECIKFFFRRRVGFSNGGEVFREEEEVFREGARVGSEGRLFSKGVRGERAFEGGWGRRERGGVSKGRRGESKEGEGVREGVVVVLT